MQKRRLKILIMNMVLGFNNIGPVDTGEFGHIMVLVRFLKHVKFWHLGSSIFCFFLFQLNPFLFFSPFNFIIQYLIYFELIFVICFGLFFF